MDMKKILATLDGVASAPVTGSNDMKKFMSIIRESAVAKESVITSFEADSVGGDANTFLIDADKINDLVMSNIDKIKINADEQLLKDMMSKFNTFMSSYHAVGKDILQPGLFDDKMGVEIEEAGYRGRRDSYQRDYDSSVRGMGKRDSLAYQQDGGANDEGEDDEPRQQRPAPSKGMYFYNVPAGKESDAEAYGLKKTKSGKWYSKTKSAVLDKAFGPGRYWEPKPASEGNPFQVKPMAVSLDYWEKAVRARYPDAKFATQKTPNGATMAMNASGQVGIYDPKRSYSKVGPEVEEGVAEGEQNVAEGSAHGYNVVRWYRKNRNSSKITAWLKKEAGLPKETKLYFDDADLVLGSDTVVPEALVDDTLKFNDLLTALVKVTGGPSKEKVDGVYRAQGVPEGNRSFKDYLALSEGLKDAKDNPCWTGYKPVGTKKKGGKTVPNCVPNKGK